MTIRPLVDLLAVKKKQETKRSINEEIHTQVPEAGPGPCVAGGGLGSRGSAKPYTHDLSQPLIPHSVPGWSFCLLRSPGHPIGRGGVSSQEPEVGASCCLCLFRNLSQVLGTSGFREEGSARPRLAEGWRGGHRGSG